MVIVAVLPCRNEEKNIGDIVQRAKRYVDAVIVVDDRSKDGTRYVARQAGADVVGDWWGNGRGRGVGFSIRYGLIMARLHYPDTEVFVTLDGDGQHNPDEIPQVLKPIIEGDADFVIGSRFLNDYKLPKYRKLGNDVLTWLYNAGRKPKILDSQSGFRSFKREVLDVSPTIEDGFSSCVEYLVKVRAKGFRVKEVPISCIYFDDYRQNSTLNPIRHGLLVAFGTVKWRVRVELLGSVKQLFFDLLKMVAKPLVGKGLKLRWLRNLYSVLTKKMMSEQDSVIEINDCLIKVSTDVRGLDGMTGTLVSSGVYEPLTTEVFKHILKEGMKVIDVGAHIGYYTLLSSKLVGESGKVWAIEPEPKNFKDLQGNIFLNGLKNVIAVNKAVSNSNGESQFFVSKMESGEHSLLACRSNLKDTIEVDTIRLDNLILDGEVDFIKTDTEGNEIAVLEGAKNIIAKNQNIKIVTEVWFPGIQASGHSPSKLWTLLRDYGFERFYLLDEIGKKVYGDSFEITYVKAIERCQAGKFSVNLLCSREPLDIEFQKV